MTVKLGVNIDHVATLRQARGTIYPDPVEAALIAIDAGAEGITMHLREDRRHIQDNDVVRMREVISVPLNLEMAVTEEMLGIAESIEPANVCLVPEKREELTTEGGLDVLSQEVLIAEACARLAAVGIVVSLFIDPELEQIDAAKRCGAPVIELHTGTYCEAVGNAQEVFELERLVEAAAYAEQLGMVVNGGHGLNCANVAPIAAIPQMNELNIGHSIIADAVFVGLPAAIEQLKQSMGSA